MESVKQATNYPKSWKVYKIIRLSLDPWVYNEICNAIRSGHRETIFRIWEDLGTRNLLGEKDGKS